MQLNPPLRQHGPLIKDFVFHDIHSRSLIGVASRMIKLHVRKCSFFFTLMVMAIEGCGDEITNPTATSDYSICYEKIYNGIWEVYINDITGAHPKNISNSLPRVNDEPRWSPDGKYIAFTNSKSHLYLYDVLRDTLRGLIVSDTALASGAIWLPDSKKIVCSYQSTSQSSGWYMMDVPDGSNRTRLKYPVTYFYPDGYNTVYVLQNTSECLVYRSNLDGTVNDFVVDLKTFVSTSTGAVSVCDFDPFSNNLLVSFDDPSTALPNSIAIYDISAKRLDTVIVSDSGRKCYRPKFFNDFKKIAMAEVQTTDNPTSRISIVENSVKSVLLEFKEDHVDLDFHPLAFSTDDKYLMFAKDVFQSGSMVSWISYIYVIQTDTRDMTLIDMTNQSGERIWNPSTPH
jgi:Tol biopolymer transport system component